MPQIPDLTAATTLTDDDLLLVVNDPATTRGAKKITVADARANLTHMPAEFYNVRPGSFARWSTALAGARANSRGPAKILWIGDSLAEGFSVDLPSGQSERNSRPSVRLLNQLNGTLVPYEKAFDGIMGFNNGVGPQAYDLLWTPGATFGTLVFSLSWGLTGIYDANAAVGAPTSIGHYGPIVCDGFNVYYLKSSFEANPTMTLGLDGGGSTVTINANHASTDGGIGVATITAGSYASHTLDIHSVASTSGYLLTVEPFRTATHGLISVGSAGIGATQTSHWADTTNAGNPGDCVDSVAPDLVIVSLGGNDQNSNVSAATFDTNLRAIVVNAQATADVITMGTPPNNLSNPTKRYEYRDVYRDIALDTGSAHIDMGLRWGDDFDATDIAGLVSTDGLHPSKFGYTDMAKAVAEALMFMDRS